MFVVPEMPPEDPEADLAEIIALAEAETKRLNKIARRVLTADSVREQILNDAIEMGYSDDDVEPWRGRVSVTTEPDYSVTDPGTPVPNFPLRDKMIRQMAETYSDRAALLNPQFTWRGIVQP